MIPTLNLPDPDDRHVLAAAIHVKAHVIVTSNLKDFPDPILNKYSIETQIPDDFACSLLQFNPEAVISVLREQRSDLKHPPKSATQMLEDFVRHRLKRFSKNLAVYVQSL